jgi:hypothetical protein
MKRVSDKQRERNKIKAEETKKMFTLFKEIWDEQESPDGECVCYETGQHLPGYLFRGNSACYHHVLEKGTYPEYKLVKKNIVIIHPDIHQSVHQSIEKTPKIKKYKEYLLTLHKKGELLDGND